MQAATSPSVVVAPTVPGAPGTVTVTLPSAPTTRAEMRALAAHRSEVSSQLNNVTSRRNDIARQVTSATGAGKAGLETRLAVLDKRLVELENDLAVTGAAQANARGAAAGYTEDPSPGPGNNDPSAGQVTAMAIVFFLAVLMPLSIAFATRLVRRGSKQAAERASPEILQRLDRMEEGIEAVAIEIERISEGQRFVTRLLGEGAAQPIALKQGEPAAVDGRS